MRPIAALLLLLLLPDPFAASAFQTGTGQPTGTTPAPSGGVTADRVENVTINNYLNRRRDPQRQALSSVMVRFSAQMNEALSPFRAGHVHVILYDQRDPFFSGVTERTYFFVVMPAETANAFSEETDRCMFQDGLALLGFVATVHRGSRVDINSQTVSLEDLLFQRLCDSLGADARQSWGHAGAGSNDGGRPFLSNYDVLSRGRSSVMVLQFTPGVSDGMPFEQRAAREYWGGAFSGNDVTQPHDTVMRLLERRLGPSDATAILAESEETGRLFFSLDPAAFAEERSFERVAREATSYFGPTFTEMDATWAQSLNATTVIVNSRPRRLVVNGGFEPIAERFRLNEVGSARFWQHLSDGAELLQSLSCLATIFAVDQDYATSGELPAYAACQLARQGAEATRR